MSSVDTQDALLHVQGLTVAFSSRFGEQKAIDAVSLHIDRGEIVGLVGESGAGKSTIGAAVMGLLPGSGRIVAGSVTFAGERVDQLDDNSWLQWRGNRVSMIFQDPQTSLNPLITVGDQLEETIRQHADISGDEARARALALLDDVGIHDAQARLEDYPHTFSGGMRQRVVIALALCTDPDLIIADEPTTALDVAIQQQVLDLIRKLAQERQIGVLLITHDIGVIAEVTDRVIVLQGGRVRESGATAQVLGQPAHEYTQALMAAVPRLDRRLERFTGIVAEQDAATTSTWQVKGASDQFAMDWLLADRGGVDGTADDVHDPILDIDAISVVFGARSGGLFGVGQSDGFVAIDDVSFSVKAGGTLGLVGESGSGKSTIAKVLTGLVTPSAGSLRFEGELLPTGRARSRRHTSRRRLQMIFQDPYSSLNNRHRVERILAEPLAQYAHVTVARDRRRLVASMLDLVGLPQRSLLRYPHQFSGGQRQRIAIARALLARPVLLIADEPTSALDVSVQAEVLNLLKDLQDTFGLSLLFISHDLAVVRQMADDIVVLRKGRIVEAGNSDAFFRAPSSDYGRELLELSPSTGQLVSPA